MRKGFTLIELLVVIAIIGLLSSVILSSLDAARMKARDAHRIADLHSIRTALALYYNDHGSYPPSSCGYDCNGYDYSYNSTWNTLQTYLAPYITLPKDPLNTACAPWNAKCYSYAYGNVGNKTHTPQYDLTAQLEDPGNPQRCAVRHYVFMFTDQLWCGGYSSQIYEDSPM